jgi:hypothetical protein
MTIGTSAAGSLLCPPESARGRPGELTDAPSATVVFVHSDWTSPSVAPSPDNPRRCSLGFGFTTIGGGITRVLIEAGGVWMLVVTTLSIYVVPAGPDYHSDSHRHGRLS